MKNIANNWIEWWNTENVVTHTTWLNNMKTFIAASDVLLHYNSQDVILDVGCGPGYLEEFLKDRVKEIHCLDTSQRYLDICKDKFSGYQNLYFYKLPEDNYTDLSFLNDKKFSIIICQSVIQYYKEIKEVEKLINEVQSIALPGSKFLIADIPVQNRMSVHVYRLIKGAIKERRLVEVTKMLLKTILSAKHRRTYLSLGILTFSDEILKTLISRLKLDAEVLRSKITVNENRRHLLIRF